MRSKAKATRPMTCTCGWTGRSGHDPALCQRERKAYTSTLNRPPEGATRRGNDHREWASGTGSGYGEWYPMPFAGQVRARILEC
jgi:hypothetical protein